MIKLLTGLDTNLVVKTRRCEKSPLHHAVERRCKFSAEMLLRNGADANATANKSETALHLAVRNEDHEIVRHLLKYGSNIDAENDSGDSPWELVAFGENEEIMELFLRHGASVDVKHKRLGCTPFHNAVSNQRESIVRLLLKYGADVNSRTGNGKYPIHCIAETRRLSRGGSEESSTERMSRENIMKLLITRGTILDGTDVHGNTALHYAFQCSNLVAIKILFAYNVDVNIRNDYGRLPIQCLSFLFDIHVSGEFIKHIAKLKSENAFVDEGNVQFIHLQPQWKDIYIECESELARMRNESIYINLSFYDVLMKSEKTFREIYVRNKYVAAVHKAKMYVEKFPRYACMLSDIFVAAEDWTNLKRSATKSLHVLIQRRISQISCIQFPDLLIQEILHRLSLDDFRNLKAALSVRISTKQIQIPIHVTN